MSKEIAKRHIRTEILGLEESLKADFPEATYGDRADCPLTHSFSDGIYVRKIKIPAGLIATGKIHKHRHPNFLMSGTVRVVTEGGGEQLLEGPCDMISPSGTKRALYAITDLVWITVHHNPTNTRDIEKLEKEIIADSYEDYEKFIDPSRESFIRRIINKIRTI